MKTLAEYEELAALAHGHMCAGQVLGLRLAMHGVELLGIDDPAGKDRKRLVTYVEIDRCATDAITVVTGCRLGKRALKFKDFGKMAATFCDLKEDRAIRVSAKKCIPKFRIRTASKWQPTGKCPSNNYSTRSGCVLPSDPKSSRAIKANAAPAPNVVKG
jgi:formylmethanofuran dehydrogenase subunit E